MDFGGEADAEAAEPAWHADEGQRQGEVRFNPETEFHWPAENVGDPTTSAGPRGTTRMGLPVPDPTTGAQGTASFNGNEDPWYVARVKEIMGEGLAEKEARQATPRRLCSPVQSSEKALSVATEKHLALSRLRPAFPVAATGPLVGAVAAPTPARGGSAPCPRCGGPETLEVQLERELQQRSADPTEELRRQLQLAGLPGAYIRAAVHARRVSALELPRATGIYR